MTSVLRQPPYSLSYKDLVVARVRARNAIGWAHSFSDPNTIGAHI